MNATTRAGIRRAVDAAWEYLPQGIVASIVASFVFLGGLWLGHRDLVSVVDGLAAEQHAPRLCTRIGECPVCERLMAVSDDVRRSISAAEHHIDSHNRESEEWKRRIIRLEQQVYEMITSPKARPDPFTGSMGRALEERIKALEENP